MKVIDGIWELQVGTLERLERLCEHLGNGMKWQRDQSIGTTQNEVGTKTMADGEVIRAISTADVCTLSLAGFSSGPAMLCHSGPAPHSDSVSGEGDVRGFRGPDIGFTCIETGHLLRRQCTE